MRVVVLCMCEHVISQFTHSIIMLLKHTKGMFLHSAVSAQSD